MDLDLNCVASFLVLLDERHYGRAAGRLNLTPSAVSKQIQRLERQVGVPLVLRHSAGGCTATEAGMRFAAHTRELMAIAEAAKLAARTDLSPTSERLILGVPDSPLEYLHQLDLSRVVAEVRLSHPRLKVECRRVAFSALTTSLVGKTIDVLLTTSPVHHAAAVSIPLQLAMRRIAVVSRSHPLAEATEIDVGDFLDMPFLYSPDIPQEWMTPFYLGDIRPGREARLVEARAEQASEVLREVARGTGMTTGPELLAHLVPSTLRAVRLRGAPLVKFQASYRRTDRSSAVQAFVSALQRIPAHPVNKLTEPAAT
ncbi:MAG TPA: LysR family transcriptional regulator [Propionibacteriaceae bacterium]|nr:LysR family transcriptional regulator [Propionibacteriaceae bacterium]